MAGAACLMAASLAIADPVAKDVVDGEVGTLTCDEVITGRLSADEDETLDDGRLVDRYRYRNSPPNEDVVRLRADAAAISLVVDDPDSRIGPIEARIDEPGAEVSILYPTYFADDYAIQVVGGESDSGTSYELSVDCVPIEFYEAVLPRDSAERLGAMRAWSGIFRQLGADGTFAPGVGLALDIQRGAIFGVIYDYDETGAPRFVTLQGTKTTGAPRRDEGSLFRTSGGQTTSQIGVFSLELAAVIDASTVFLTTTLDGAEPDVGTSQRFFFVADDREGFFQDTTFLIDIETEDPDELALLDRIGRGFRTRLASRIERPFCNCSLFVESLKGGYSGPFSFSVGGLVRVDLSNEAFEGEVALFQFTFAPNGLSGTAAIRIGDALGERRSASALLVSASRLIVPAR